MPVPKITPVTEGAKKFSQGFKDLDYFLVAKNRLTKKQVDFLKLWFKNGCHNTNAYLELDPNVSKAHAAVYAGYILNSPAVQGYLYELSNRAMIDPQTEEAIITIPQIVQNLADITNSKDEKSADRIKAAEILLKHLNGFEAHNNSRATKVLAIINEKSDDELLSDINTTMKSLGLTITNHVPNKKKQVGDPIYVQSIDEEPSELDQQYNQVNDGEEIIDYENIDTTFLDNDE
jgi:hypothetical protein